MLCEFILRFGEVINKVKQDDDAADNPHHQKHVFLVLHHFHQLPNHHRLALYLPLILVLSLDDLVRLVLKLNQTLQFLILTDPLRILNHSFLELVGELFAEGQFGEIEFDKIAEDIGFDRDGF